MLTRSGQRTGASSSISGFPFLFSSNYISPIINSTRWNFNIRWLSVEPEMTEASIDRANTFAELIPSAANFPTTTHPPIVERQCTLEFPRRETRFERYWPWSEWNSSQPSNWHDSSSRFYLLLAIRTVTGVGTLTRRPSSIKIGRSSR